LKQLEKIAHDDVCIFIDGDGTYLPCEFEQVAKQILSGEADMVIGSRSNQNMEKGSYFASKQDRKHALQSHREGHLQNTRFRHALRLKSDKD
jgi:glycosyltransferase involved in cell wall biosynthesis